MKNLTVSEIYEAATNAAKSTLPYEVVEVSVWNEKRIYVNFPEQSNKYKTAGYVDIKTGQSFPACGNNPRSSRDHDAIRVLDAVAGIFTEEKQEDEKPFVSSFLKF